MTLNQARSSTPLLSPEEIAVRAGQQVPHLHLPNRHEVFAERQIRLRQLAASHPMRDFLIFMADVASAQHDILKNYPTVSLPTAEALDAASRSGMPPVPAAHWPRDPVWRTQFRRLLDLLLPRLEGSPAQVSVRALRDIDDDTLERQADRLLQNIMFGLDMAAAPLIAAGLQTYWTHLVLATQDTRGSDRLAPFGRVEHATLCPCCGSRPTSSISRIDPSAGGYRYLHCALCSAEWHMVRIKCSHCESTKGIHYQSLQPVGATPAAAQLQPAVEVETCDECQHYLKIVRMDRDNQVEPVADDLATVTLDLLVSEAGFQRHGINLMLLFGDPDAAADADADAVSGAG
ncbi:MAG: formate dehydrogenase accessory protein FdhE [Polaromonas sp.]|nr:formate dehydrogenase accessory protein FdhE [Polaromonas sp.]